MLLFLVLDESDDGYIQKDEWMELYQWVVLSDDKYKPPQIKDFDEKQARSEMIGKDKKVIKLDVEDEGSLKEAFEN